MIVQILLFFCVLFTIDGQTPMNDKLHAELELSKTTDEDLIIPFLCKMLPSPEFIQATDDEDLLSSLLYQLGFGVLGVKPNSWAAKFRDNLQKPAACFAALHTTASADVAKSTLASSRKIIARCCASVKDL